MRTSTQAPLQRTVPAAQPGVQPSSTMPLQLSSMALPQVSTLDGSAWATQVPHTEVNDPSGRGDATQVCDPAWHAPTPAVPAGPV